MSAAALVWQVAAAAAASPQLRGAIQRRPYAALGVAAAAGWLLARRAPVGLVPALLVSGGRAALSLAVNAAVRGRGAP